MKRPPYTSVAVFVLALLVLLTLAACGGAGGPAATAIPTFTPIPTYKFEEPTAEAIKVTDVPTAEETAAVAALDPALVEKGKGRYEALECASCHGPNGEGTDKGSSLIVSTQSEDDFITFMRSGGSLGSSHQYSTNRLSASGGKSLYAYLLSLRKSS